MWHLQPRSQTAELDEVEEGLLQSEKPDKAFASKTDQNVGKHGRGWLRLNWSWILQSAVLACSSTLFILSRYGEPSDAACTRKIFPYSPALDVVTYHAETLQGAFLQPSPYRGTPTPEIDGRWQELWNLDGLNVPEDKIHLLNKSRSEPWHHTDPEFGGGIAAQFWGFHQIHCSDLLRQMSYKKEYKQAGRGMPELLRASEKVRRTHLDHCIEVLRLNMMCLADVTPHLVIDAAAGEPPDALRIDFSISKKCRDFDRIRDWMKDHIAVVSIMDKYWLRPNGPTR